MSRLAELIQAGAFPAPGGGPRRRRILFGRGWAFVPLVVAGLACCALGVARLVGEWAQVEEPPLSDLLPHQDATVYLALALGGLLIAALSSLPPKQVVVRPERNELSWFRGLVWRIGRVRVPIDAVQELIVDHPVDHTSASGGAPRQVRLHRCLVRVRETGQLLEVCRLDYPHSAGRVAHQLREALDKPLEVYVVTREVEPSPPPSEEPEEASQAARPRSPLEEQVRRQLRGGTVWVSRDDQEATDGLERELSRAEGERRRALAEAVVACLGHRDPKVRTGAVRVAYKAAEVLGVRPLVEAFRRDPAAFVGVPGAGYTFSHPDLRWGLLVTVSSLLGAEDREAIELLREHVAGERGSWLLGGLARHDVDWLIAHAERVPPASICGVLRSVARAADRERLLRAMRWTPEQAEATLQASAWASLPFDARERDALAAVVRGAAQDGSHGA